MRLFERRVEVLAKKPTQFWSRAVKNDSRSHQMKMTRLVYLNMAGEIFDWNHRQCSCDTSIASAGLTLSFYAPKASMRLKKGLPVT